MRNFWNKTVSWMKEHRAVTGAALGIFLLDHLSKAAVLFWLPDEPVKLLPFFYLRYVENTGAAFGMMQGGKWFFLAITGIACAAMLYFLIKERKRLHFMMTFSLALLLSGAIGNLIDRVALGYVRDMIYVALIDFAVFNVADMAVTVGCCLLVLDLLFFKGKKYMEMMDKKPQTGENS